MPLPNPILWKKILEYEMDDPDSDFTFTDRLCRENDWNFEFGVRVVLEYKRFMYLICVTDGPLTPSDQVDQAWHLHLLYTQSYWLEFCRKILQKEIHHGPTKGGTNEKVRFNDLYAKCKDRYREVFEMEPPDDIWPPSHIRFGQIIFTRVNRHKYWIFPKFKFFNMSRFNPWRKKT